jgi:hypothetical protein
MIWSPTFSLSLAVDIHSQPACQSGAPRLWGNHQG